MGASLSQTTNLRREGCVHLAWAGFKKTTFYTANNSNFPLSQEGKKLLDRMQSPRRPPGVSQSGSAVADLRFFERLGWHYPPPLPLAMSMSDYFHLTLEIYPSSLTHQGLVRGEHKKFGFLPAGSRRPDDFRFRFPSILSPKLTLSP